MPDEETQTTDEQTNSEAAQEKTLTESQVNAIIAKEKAKAEKAARSKWEAEQAEKERQANQTAEERAKESERVAKEAAKEAEARANTRIVRADAKGVAQTLGFRPDRISEVLQFADLSDVTVNDAGDADVKAISAALKPLLERFPEWKADAKGKDIGGGFNSGEKGPAEPQSYLEALQQS